MVFYILVVKIWIWQKYSLYSIDGRLVQQNNITTSQIDISKQPERCLSFKKIETKESALQQVVILK